MISYSKPLTKLEKINLYALSMHARDLKQNLKFVDYQQAERYCEQLASRLKDTFTSSELDSFAFMAIPRGGIIVLGILAYALNLKSEQLITSPQQADTPLIIVDDCSLTGLRFGEYLESTTASQVVFAHLFSSESLRQNIVAREARVSHCIAAQNLKERPFPKTETQSLGSHQYWSGSTELVAFSWSEPSLLTSLISANHTSEGWHLVSPQQCLNNRVKLDVSSYYRITPNIFMPKQLLYYWHDGILILADSDTGEVFKLQELASIIWRHLIAVGNLNSAIALLKSEYDINKEAVETFLETAVSVNLLTYSKPETTNTTKMS